MPGSRRRRPLAFAWATRLGGWRTLSSANATVSNAALATPQKARFRGASGRLDLLGKGFLERGGSATKWYHSPAPPRGGPAGRSAGELLNKPEGRDGLRDLPAGPGQPVQMPGMRGRALFALYEGAPEESLLAARCRGRRGPSTSRSMSAEIPAQAQPGRLKMLAGPAITGTPRLAGREAAAHCRDPLAE